MLNTAGDEVVQDLGDGRPTITEPRHLENQVENLRILRGKERVDGPRGDGVPAAPPRRSRRVESSLRSLRTPNWYVGYLRQC